MFTFHLYVIPTPDHRCPNGGCDVSLAATHHSCLYRSKLNKHQLLLLAAEYVKPGRLVNKAVAARVGLTVATVEKWFRYFDMCGTWMAVGAGRRLLGQGKLQLSGVVEVDEVLLMKRKWHQGALGAGQQVLGWCVHLVERHKPEVRKTRCMHA
jgi:hypothetical protein